MAIARVKVWSSGEVLTAADLNGEFNNIINNATSLISPLTADLAFGGFRATGLSLGSITSPSVQFTGDTNTGMWSSAADVLDFSSGGIRVLQLATVASGVNYWLATPSATTTPVLLAAAGSDTDVGLRIAAKGAGTVSFWDGGTSGRELLILDGAASAVNELTIVNAATGADPTISPTGDDAAISITITPKSTGIVKLTSAVSNENLLSLISTSAGAVGPGIHFFHNSASPANSDTTAVLKMRANDNGGTERTIVAIESIWDDITSTTMDSHIGFSTMNNVNAGNVNTTATLTSTGIWTDAPCDLEHKVYEGTPKEIWGDILAKVKQLNVSRFHAKFAAKSKEHLERHVAPTMDQLHDLFGVGSLNPKTKKLRGIAALDVAGVALVGLQALIARVEALEESKEKPKRR